MAIAEQGEIETLSDLLNRLGRIPPERIHCHPTPGTATEDDLLRYSEGQKRLFELVDGVLVEKPMGFYESQLAAALIGFLEAFLREHNLGAVFGADAPLRLAPGLVRLPDVCFVTWERLPEQGPSSEPVQAIAPDLAVEVLSRHNTVTEMERKLGEYFRAGTRLVWYLNPRTVTVTVYTSPADFRVLQAGDVLDGEDVLPGFRLSVQEWLNRASRPKAKPP